MKWWYAIGVLLLLGAGFWVYKAVTVTPPGVRMEDQGQQHVTPQEVASFIYNSNPPTSGPHLPTWVKPGIYTVPQPEGELIHSLEHGYVIVSYNCNVHLRAELRTQNSMTKRIPKVFINRVFAHEEAGATPSAEFVDPTVSTASAVNETDACKSLIRQLKELAERKKLFKLIVVPRPPQSNAAGTFDVPQLDTTIALTAWGYIDKFDTFNAKRIERFIDFHRDHGPEKTME